MAFAALDFAVVLATTAQLVTAALSPDANSPQAFLTAHNAWRSAQITQPLLWNTSLAAYALNYANSQKSKCFSLKHSGGPYGENLFWGSGRAFVPKDAVDAWGGEVSYYDYARNQCQFGKVCSRYLQKLAIMPENVPTGWTYPQVVWRTTTQVGCATVECSDNSNFIICDYYPPGNYPGMRPY